MTLKCLVVLAVALLSAASALPQRQYFDSRALDGQYAPTVVRVRRDLPHHDEYASPTHHDPYAHKSHHKAPVYKHHHKPGKVGPVYTFVKTDYHGNAKWGVRHRVGSHYAGGGY